MVVMVARVEAIALKPLTLNQKKKHVLMVRPAFLEGHQLLCIDVVW